MVKNRKRNKYTGYINPRLHNGDILIDYPQTGDFYFKANLLSLHNVTYTYGMIVTYVSPAFGTYYMG